MRVNDKGLTALHLREGLRLKPYLDTKGVPTIAMGNTYYLDGRSVTMKDPALSPKEANKLSLFVADDFGKYVNSKIKSSVNQDQFNACVSISYNIGKKGFSSSTFLKLLNINPNDTKIAAAIMMWVKDKELIPRRLDEVNQYFTNIPNAQIKGLETKYMAIYKAYRLTLARNLN
jgi:lysozyme